MKLTLAIAALLFALYSAFIQLGPRPDAVKTQSQWQDNRHVLEDYVAHGEGAQVVLVGSSLTRRLDVRSWGSCAFNLAVAGESSLTGLRLLVDAGFQPREVVVEINVPQRPINLQLIGEATSLLRSSLPVMRTQNSPVNLGLSFLYGRRDATADENISPAVFDSAFASQQAAFEQEIDHATLAGRLEEFAHLVTVLERRGSKVVLLELPTDVRLEQLARPRQVRRAFEIRFPSLRLVAPEALSAGHALQTLDGVHLKTPDAAQVTRRLKDQLSACQSDATPQRVGADAGSASLVAQPRHEAAPVTGNGRPPG